MANDRRRYIAPECEYEGAFIEDLFCASPVDGGLEGTSEEDWTL